MATGWPLKTTFTNGNALPASDLNDITGTVNNIYSTTYPNQLSYLSGAVTRPLPYAIAADSATITITSAASGSYAFTFPTGRFTLTPIVTGSNVGGTSSTQFYSVVGGLSSSGCTVSVYQRDGTVVASASVAVAYHAIQMTSATAAG